MKFLYQITKTEEKENICINSFFAEKNKNKIKKNNEKKYLKYHLYIRKKDLNYLIDKIPSLKKEIIILDKKYKNKEKEEIKEIFFKNKDSFIEIIKIVKENNFPSYELDLPSEHRFLIENKTSFDKVKLNYISLDIETILINKKPIIIAISLYCSEKSSGNYVFLNTEYLEDNVKKSIINYKNKYFKLFYLNSEKELLIELKKKILEINPHIILGWNVIDFDFKIIKERMNYYKIEFKFSNFEGDFKLRINEDFFKESTLTGPSIIFFDVINLLKINFINFEDYKLNTVAKEILKDEKIELELSEKISSKIDAITQLYSKNPIKLVEYNFKDSFLTYRIVEKLNLIELMQQRSILTKTPLMKIKSPIATLDIMYLEKLHKRGFVANTNFNFNNTTPIEGAYVITPKKGFYEDVFVFDFKSLYPSIIMTFNIDPFTISKNGCISAPNGIKFEQKEGILPELIKKLYSEREIAKKKKDKIKSYAIKTTMN